MHQYSGFFMMLAQGFMLVGKYSSNHILIPNCLTENSLEAFLLEFANANKDKPRWKLRRTDFDKV